jgi:membrane protein DedA with SNARE-associated domain
MDLELSSRPLACVVVLAAAAIEGEMVLIAASVLVGLGKLDPLATWLSGALGGAAGDQFFYYALRGRLRRWLAQWPRVAERQEAVIARVRRHQLKLIFGCRFLPGLRIAIPAACAYAEIPPVRFTLFNLVGALAWSATVIGVVAWAGPQSLAWLGVPGPWRWLLPAFPAVVFVIWVTRRRKNKSIRT